MDLNGINTLLDAAGKTIEKVPAIYNDGLSSTVKEGGKTLSLIPRTVNAILSGLEKWVMYKEFSIKETQLLLEEKLKNISPEKIVEPEPYVAVPALQAISYCMDCKELRNLYANLLAKSMNEETKFDSHPAYVEMIKQLSPLDAQIINELKLFDGPNKLIPIGMLRFCKEDKNSKFNIPFAAKGLDVCKHIVDIKITDASHDAISISIENLERLGLISIDYNKSLVGRDYYTNIENNDLIEEVKDYFKKIYNELPGYEDFGVSFIKGTIQVTTLGFSFSKTCCVDL